MATYVKVRGWRGIWSHHGTNKDGSRAPRPGGRTVSALAYDHDPLWRVVNMPTIVDDRDDIPLLVRPDWQAEAACRGVGTDIFFAPPRESNRDRATTYAYTEARALCATCPVIEDCRTFMESLDGSQHRHGFWAGTAPQERRAARRADEQPKDDPMNTTGLSAADLRQLAELNGNLATAHRELAAAYRDAAERVERQSSWLLTSGGDIQTTAPTYVPDADPPQCRMLARYLQPGDRFRVDATSFWYEVDSVMASGGHARLKVRDSHGQTHGFGHYDSVEVIRPTGHDAVLDGHDRHAETLAARAGHPHPFA